MPTVIQLLSAKVSYRDVYNQLWSNRDLEIKHVWQRAIFLTAFLIACFAGYGGLVLAVITPGKSVISPATANGIAFVIAIVGLIFSLLWVMLAKGSKMWYENYENAIEAFRVSFVSTPLHANVDAFDQGVDKIAGINLSDVTGFVPPTTSDWIWSTNGGRFSVSRINVFVGQFSLLIWSTLLIAHIAIAKVGAKTLSEVSWVKSLLTNWEVMSAFAVVTLLVFWLFSHCSLKSK